MSLSELSVTLRAIYQGTKAFLVPDRDRDSVRLPHLISHRDPSLWETCLSGANKCNFVVVEIQNVPSLVPILLATMSIPF